MNRLLGKHIENHRKHGHDTENGDEGAPRKQFNATIYPGLIDGIRDLAAVFSVPRWTITEHALQVGIYHLMMASREQQNEKIIRNHLVKQHLLSPRPRDSQRLLRIHEPAYPAELLSDIRYFLKLIGTYQDALESILAGRNVSLARMTIEKCRQELGATIEVFREYYSRRRHHEHLFVDQR